MSPYRDTRCVVPVRARGKRGRRTTRRKFAGCLLAAIALRALGLLWHDDTMLELCLASIIVGLVMATWGRSRTPFARLCALQWNRGDRLGAVLLFFNVAEPRCSAKRRARNRDLLEAAQGGVPQRGYRPFRFHFVDYHD